MYRNYQDNVPPLDHHVNVSIAEMEADPYYWIDYWPVPMSWISSLFNPDAWDAAFRRYRTEGTKMGPLTEGTRRMVYDLEGYYNTVRQRKIPGPDRPLDISMTLEEKSRWINENSRRGQARKIITKLKFQESQNWLYGAHPETRRDGVIDNLDSKWSDTDDEEDEPTPTCKRWNEIKNYLFANRGPNELAWDSMIFDIAEWTLYRYITERGGINLSPVEWHDFLVFADHKKQLFQYIFYPPLPLTSKK